MKTKWSLTFRRERSLFFLLFFRGGGAFSTAGTPQPLSLGLQRGEKMTISTKKVTSYGNAHCVILGVDAMVDARVIHWSTQWLARWLMSYAGQARAPT